MKNAKTATVDCIMVGCDLHDENMLLKIASGKEKPRTASYGNTFAGRRRMIADLSKQALKAGGAKVHFVYEASGLGFTLCDDLREAGFSCDVVAPTKMERSPKHRRTKTDEKDAEALLAVLRAHLLAGNELPKVWIPDKQTRDDREITRARLDVGDKLTTVKTQVQTLLKSHGIRKPKDVGKPWTVSHRGWLRELAQAKKEQRGVGVHMGSLLRQLEMLEDEMNLLGEEIARLAQEPRYKAACAAISAQRGVGQLTAMVFLTELGDLARFSNGKQIGCYMGLVPSSNESGEKKDRKGHITGEGPARIRKVLCQAAWSWVRLNEQPGGQYAAMVERGKSKKKALVAAMRKLGVHLWHVGLEALKAQAMAAVA